MLCRSKVSNVDIFIALAFGLAAVLVTAVVGAATTMPTRYLIRLTMGVGALTMLIVFVWLHGAPQ